MSFKCLSDSQFHLWEEDQGSDLQVLLSAICAQKVLLSPEQTSWPTGRLSSTFINPYPRKCCSKMLLIYIVRSRNCNKLSILVSKPATWRCAWSAALKWLKNRFYFFHCHCRDTELSFCIASIFRMLWFRSLFGLLGICVDASSVSAQRLKTVKH